MKKHIIAVLLLAVAFAGPLLAKQGPELYQESQIKFDQPRINLPVENPGKVLVIEHVSFQLLVDSGGELGCEVSVYQDGMVVVQHDVLVELQASFVGGDRYAASTPIRMYAPSGSEIRMECSLVNSFDFTNMRGSISGQWVDE